MVVLTLLFCLFMPYSTHDHAKPHFTDVHVHGAPPNGPVHSHFTSNHLLSLLILDHARCICPHSLLVLDTFILHDSPSTSSAMQSVSTGKKSLSRPLILLLLLASGNVNVNPGPLSSEGPNHLSTPADLANSHGLRFLHINARSLVRKLDLVKTWFIAAKPDIVIISETWLKPRVTDDILHIDGFNIFRCDRKSHAGGIAIYVANKFHVTTLNTIATPKEFELLALQIKISDVPLTIVGCYRFPRAVAASVPNLTAILTDLISTEVVVIGDLNLNWLNEQSDSFKADCSDLGLVQLIDSPTRHNPKRPENDSLLDIILTNAPHKFTATGVFADGLSDHCVIGCVRNTRLPKTQGLTIVRRCFKHFSEQAFLSDLANLNWEAICLIGSIDDAVSFFR